MAQLAQVNIARLLAAEGDERVQGFFANIERINAISEASHGFIWRYAGDDQGEAGVDPLLVFNLSVWQSCSYSQTLARLRKRLRLRNAMTPLLY